MPLFPTDSLPRCDVEKENGRVRRGRGCGWREVPERRRDAQKLPSL